MSVFAAFRYEVKPGRFADFMAKLGEAASPKFDSPFMPKSVKLLRSAVPDTDGITLLIEYDDMAAYGARTAFENANAEWRALFEAQPDSPEQLISVELFTEVTPE